MSIEFTTPIGRIVQGSLYRGRDKDDKGQPLVYKTGANQGQPRTDYFFALAIEKGQEQNWWETEWGGIIAGAGQGDWPNGEWNSPSFAWKVIDGDSPTPNKKGRLWSSYEGYAGHWVLTFTGTTPPRTFTTVNTNAPHEIFDNDLINAGDYVRVFGSASGNKSTQSPGVYLNYSGVCLFGYGPRISIGFNVDDAGFTENVGHTPAGMSNTPVGGNASMQGMGSQQAPAQGMGSQQAPAQGMGSQQAPGYSKIPNFGQ